MSKTLDDTFEGTGDTADIQKYRRRLRAGEAAGHAYVLLLGLRTFDTPGLLDRIMRGLSYSCLERFRRNAGLSKDAVSALLQIPPRTLARRKEEGRLHVEESDRLLRASRILGLALGLFEGDADLARRWLSTEQRALGGATPLRFAATEVGAREVEALVGRLEHGIPE